MTVLSNKPIWVAIIILFTIQLTFVIWQVFTPSQIAYIDNNKLLNNYKGMLDARKAFEQKATTWQANVDTLTSEVQKAIMDYEKESTKMSKKEKSLSQQLIKTKQQQLQNYQQAIQQQYQQEDAQMTEQVLAKVNTFLTEYGKKNSYQVIFGANQSGNIIYAVDAMDITDQVLEELNKNYSGN